MNKGYVVAIVFGLSFLLTGITGCTGERSDKPGIADHLTGAEQIKTYKKTESKIQGINDTLEDRYKEIK